MASGPAGVSSNFAQISSDREEDNVPLIYNLYQFQQQQQPQQQQQQVTMQQQRRPNRYAPLPSHYLTRPLPVIPESREDEEDPILGEVAAGLREQQQPLLQNSHHFLFLHPPSQSGQLSASTALNQTSSRNPQSLLYDASAFDEMNDCSSSQTLPPPSYHSHLLSSATSSEPPPPAYQSIYESFQLQQDGKRVLHVYFVTLLFIGIYLFIMSGNMLQYNAFLKLREFSLRPSFASNNNFTSNGATAIPNHAADSSSFRVPMTMRFELDNLYHANFTPSAMNFIIYHSPYMIGQSEFTPSETKSLVLAETNRTMETQVWMELGNQKNDPDLVFLRRILLQCDKLSRQEYVALEDQVSVVIWYKLHGFVEGHNHAISASEVETVRMDKTCWIRPDLVPNLLEMLQDQLGSSNAAELGKGQVQFRGRISRPIPFYYN